MAKFINYKWRFYADNNISREIVEYLRRSDMDVLWITEVPELQRQQDDMFHYRKAAEFQRYLLTNDMDFWNDRKFPIKDSPGVIILAADDPSLAKYLPVLLRKLIRDYNPIPEPLYLNKTKIKVSTESLVLKIVDRDTQQVTTESWSWVELI
jgi:predicted nuclease of predicted toxin-antitoxin system